MLIFVSLHLFQLGCSSEEVSKENPAVENTMDAPAPSAEPEEKQEPFDPLKGKTLKEICSSFYLPLLKWRYTELQSGFTKICCTKEGLGGELPCGLDWPFSDVPSCDAYDDLRNGIYATYGYSFKKKRWEERFSEEEWYQPRDDYSEIWISAAAMENIATLKKMKDTKVNCLD